MAPGGLGAIVLVGLSAFGTAIVSGLTGFGAGLVLPAVIAPLVGVKAVVPVLAVAMMIANLSRLQVYYAGLSWRHALAVLATALPGVVVGTTVYQRLPEQAVAAILGVFLLTALPLRRLFVRWKLRIGPAGLAGAGAGYGVIAGGLSGVGMLLIPVLLGAGLQGAALLATDAAISVGINGLKTLMFGSYRLLDADLLLAGCLIGICAIPGNYCARWLLNRTGVRLHTLIMEALILIGALSFLLGR